MVQIGCDAGDVHSGKQGEREGSRTSPGDEHYDGHGQKCAVNSIFAPDASKLAVLYNKRSNTAILE
jgi:hypothetical protein